MQRTMICQVVKRIHWIKQISLSNLYACLLLVVNHRMFSLKILNSQCCRFLPHQQSETLTIMIKIHNSIFLVLYMLVHNIFLWQWWTVNHILIDVQMKKKEKKWWCLMFVHLQLFFKPYVWLKEHHLS